MDVIGRKRASMDRRQKSSTKPVEPVSYNSKHIRGVDAGGRVVLPPEWRPAKSPRDFKISLWPVYQPKHLLVLPIAKWDAAVRQILEKSPLSNNRVADVDRLMQCNTYERSLDNYGRLLLPEEGLKLLGAEPEVVLLGRSDKFEIWNSEKLTAALANMYTQLIIETIQSIGI